MKPTFLRNLDVRKWKVQNLKDKTSRKVFILPSRFVTEYVQFNEPTPFILGIDRNNFKTVFIEGSPKFKRAKPSRTPLKKDQRARITSIYDSIQNVAKTPVEFRSDILSSGRKYFTTADPEIFLAVSAFITEKDIDWKALSKHIFIQNQNYHSGTHESALTDKQFDRWKAIFVSKKKKWPLEGKVGAAPVNSRDKVKLPTQMGSLVTYKSTNEVMDWAKKSRLKEFIVTPKLDGISLLLHYKDFKLIKAFTRGDGESGQDVTRHMKAIPRLPKRIATKGDVYVRGELVMPLRLFNKYFSEQFANPRNLVAGMVNRKETNTQAFANCRFIAYEANLGTPSKEVMLNRLKDNYFDTAPYEMLLSRLGFNAEQLKATFTKFSESLGIELDGLVIEANDLENRNRLGFETNSLDPKYARAYKPDRKDNLAKTEVIKVEWRAKRSGMLKPRVFIKPVKLAGVTVNKATGFNAAFIVDNKIGPGAIVEITRAGEVIPHIVNTLKAARGGAAQYPDKKEFGEFNKDYVWNKSHVDFILDNKANNKDVRLQEIAHFFEKCGIENFKLERIKSFYEHGYMSIADIVKMDKEDITGIDRMGDKQADNILKEFKKLQHVPMHLLMYASNCFGRNLGSRKLREIVRTYGNQTLSRWDGWKIIDIAQAIAEIKGFSIESGKQFAKGIMPFHNLMKTLRPNVKGVYPSETKGGVLNGKSVCFSGFRDSNLESLIEKAGGRISTSVSSKLSYLIAADKKSTQGKASQARQLGIPIYEPQEFISKFKI